MTVPSLALNSFTITAWVYRSSAPGGWRSVVSKPVGGGDENSIYLAFKENKYTLYIRTSAGIGWLTGTTPPTNQWIHLAGLYDGSRMQIYVNGTLNATANFSGVLSVDASSIIIGADNNYGTIGEFHHGFIDDVCIYSRALTLAEIEALAKQ